ncbi:unnamed protein product [Heligmosomoides polygyrus]|uniref:Zn_Tnp_IS91 domain-containing protein n=1 Tax=Heligmosomoides polygyrus TaxID=6339 RepID=A0A183FLF0_HELPZ|nr:unnamed protein product [Heligmosomoides polygyrus]
MSLGDLATRLAEITRDAIVDSTRASSHEATSTPSSGHTVESEVQATRGGRPNEGNAPNNRHRTETNFDSIPAETENSAKIVSEFESTALFGLPGLKVRFILLCTEEVVSVRLCVCRTDRGVSCKSCNRQQGSANMSHVAIVERQESRSDRLTGTRI